jgi:hypothetical protein
VSAYFAKTSAEEGRHGVTEHHRVGDLHHRRLEVQREQQVVGLRGSICAA